MPTFSIVIPIWKRPADMLARLLATLAGQTYPPIEIIVSDTNPSDSEYLCVHAACERFPLVVHIRTPMDTFSISKAMNIGIRRTRVDVDYIACIGSDMLFSKNYFEVLASTMAPNRITQVQCGALKSSVIIPDDPHTAWEQLCSSMEPYSNRNVSPGAIICAARAWWFSVHGYDEDIFFYWPDSDIVRRAMLSGLGQLNVPWNVAQALHQWHPSGNKEPGRGLYELRLDTRPMRNPEGWGGKR